eukprot:TRINITY_DN8348_c0_g1_i3.p2 TRINITY_DN8348_c0_g1~~TRINITY_DN8348_c0_g1_i3.p2  ORF type:complete len:394 (+),score=133.77 TRINITY_DN8348_c0_g1_i3:69-1184(+)
MQRPAAGRAARSAGGGRRPRPAPGRAQRRCKACFVPPRDVTLADYQVVDCRWEERLGGGYGAAEYAKGRIKGAVYCDAENWAAAPTERSGSHPLPAVSDFAAWLRRSGLRPDGKPVLLYDDLAGAAPAARVRWMLRALGWESVWLLEGGWQGWHADGRHDLVDTSPPSPPRPVQAGAPVALAAEWDAGRMPLAPPAAVREASEAGLQRRIDPRDGQAKPKHLFAEGYLDSGDADAERLWPRQWDDAKIAHEGRMLVDVRPPFRWDTCATPVYPDTKPGHVPNAVSFPWHQLLTADESKRLLPERRLTQLIDEGMCSGPVDGVVVYCGCGVHSCFTIAVCEHLGRGTPNLYPGGLSEWAARGEETELGAGYT